MRLEFLGTGTSQGVPEILCECPVCISDDERDRRLRCSIWLSTPATNLVIDTGPDFRQQCLRSRIPRIDGVWITHLHADHIMGLDDIRRFNRVQEEDIPIFVPKHMEGTFRDIFGYTLREPSPGLFRPHLQLELVSPLGSRDYGEFSITAVPIAHGDQQIYSYLIKLRDGTRIAYVTDCRDVDGPYRKHLEEADILILGAIWRKEWIHAGHLNLDEALVFAADLGARRTIFTHITHYMGKFAETTKDLPAGFELAFDGLAIDFSQNS